MKKILIIILICLFVTGCFDYRELNKIDLVTAIAIDYQDNNYKITLEVINDQVEKDSGKIKSYTITGENNNLAEAIEDAASKLSNEANYNHLKLMVLSKSILDKKFESIIDYFLRNIQFRENFLVISSLDNDPESILKNSTEENPVASSTITNMLDSDNYSSNSAVKKTFSEVCKDLFTFGIDTTFTNISLNNKEYSIDGASIFNNYKYAGKISNKEASIYNVFTGKIYHPIISHEYNKKTFTVALTTGSPKIDLIDNKINISGDITGQVINNEPNYNIRKLDDLNKINNDFTNIINNDFNLFLNKLKSYNSDILGINNKYYLKTRKKDPNVFLNYNVSSHIEFNLNKKGIIFEVNNEN